VGTTEMYTYLVINMMNATPKNYPNNKTADTSKRITDAPSVRMGGYQELWGGEPMRAKFWKSWEKSEALTPGKMIDLNFAMPDLDHTFRQGHRIMVQIQSSWFPLVDRNPQTFVDIPNAKPEDFKKATER